MNTPLYSVSIDTITLGSTLSIFIAATVLALIWAFTYYFTRRRTSFLKTVFSTIILMVPISALVILIVGNNLARAVGIGGGIALIRYRSTMENPMDLAYTYSALAIGMACGLGFVGLACVVTAILVILAIIVSLLSYASRKSANMTLKVLIPENLDFYGVLDDVLNKHCKTWTQNRIRTTDYGTLLEIQYSITLKDVTKQKTFIDDIRARNGNLTVTLTQRAQEE